MEIIFILVEPSVPENIGASIRAINTMGFNKIRLVNPQCNHLDDNAFKLAHGSYEILRNSEVFPSLKSAIEDIDFIIGTTSKERISKNDYYSAEEVLPLIEKKGDSVSSVAIVFGRESSGMTGEEIDLCQVLSTIPMANPYPTLNLSQSVMLYAYNLSKLNISIVDKIKKNRPGNGEFKALMKRSIQLLENLEMDKESNIYSRVKERLAIVGEEDVRLLHSVLNLLEKRRD